MTFKLCLLKIKEYFYDFSSAIGLVNDPMNYFKDNLKT